MASFRAIAYYQILSGGELMNLIDRDFLLQLLHLIGLGKRLESGPEIIEAVSQAAEVQIPKDTPVMGPGVWGPDQLLDLATRLEHNGFEFSGMLIRDIGAANHSFTIAKQFPELYRRIMHELGGMLLMRIPREKAGFWGHGMPYGQAVADAFPRANQEVIEAGDCLAADQNTAAVFHLMRATEVVVKRFAALLNIPDPIKAAERNWGTMLRKIRDEIDRRIRATPPEWTDAEEREFCEDVHGNLIAVKNTLRDRTMHIEETYDYRRAKATYEAMRYFMERAATRLHE